MNASIAGSVVGATIQVTLQNIIQGPIEQIIQVWGVDEDMEKLNRSLLMIQDFVSDAEMKQVNSRAVRRWLEQLEDVAFDADAVLDEFNYEILRQKVEKPNEVITFFKSGPFRMEMADKIKSLNKRLKAINKRATEYGLQIAMSSNSSVGFTPSPTVSLSKEPQIVGRANDESTLVETLLDAVEHTTVSVLPVMGMGGLGKTTLVRKVFHNVKIQAHFEKRIWVCVSTHFDAITLFKMILQSLTKKSVEENLNEEVVLKLIQDELTSKRYLLILDDVWNENFNLWDDFMNSISAISPNKGNCILVTTRNGNVASLVGTLLTYPLQSLSEDDCWSIIRFKALSMVDDYIEFEGIGKLIAQRCGGLPLVAKVLGGLLCGTSKNEWQSLLDHNLMKFKLDGDNNDVMDLLKLSYDRLPSPAIKKCFAYCSIFPQDREIRRREVIELWMAEGFLHDGRGKYMETVGDEIFNLLLQNSLFQDVEKDQYNNITKCRMHDLVHDLACLVSGSRTITVEKGISDGLQRPRYLVESGEESFAILKQQARFLRTIFFQEGNVYMCVEFRQLHVLKIMNWRIEELPDVIGELKQLRLLDIENTRITELPDSIGKLYNLQTLCLNKALKRLPKAIVDLISLSHLHVVDDGIELPPWMGKLTCLQTLPYFKVGDGRGRGVGELRKLNNLKGSLKIQNLERVKDKEEAQDAKLKGKANIVELVLEWNDIREGEVNDENVLDGLQPHPSLKSLEIVWYKSRNWPSWTMNMAVQDLNLSYCPELESIIPCVIGFTSLRKLKIKLCSKLKELSLNQLMSLEKLIIQDCGELESISCVEGLPSLRELFILTCEKLKEITLDFICLEKLIVEFCSELKSIKIKREGEDSQQGEKGNTNNSLRTLIIYACPELIELPIELFHSSHSSLRQLKLFSLENVENLSISLSNMSALQDLTITNIPKLTTFPTIKGTSGLRSLAIGGFSSEWISSDSFNQHLNSILQENLRSLERLILFGNEDWECLPDQIQHLTSLTHLGLYDFGRMEALPEWIRNLSSLWRLWIENCKSLRHLPSKEAMLSLTKLDHLGIENCSLLAERCRDPSNNSSSAAATTDASSSSEWPKISHIEDVKIRYDDCDSEEE